MEDAPFDNLTRAIATRSRRGLLATLSGAAVALGLDAGMEDALAKRRKKKRKKKQSPPPGSGLCGGVTCPEGRLCCPDEKCGPRCCANGRACEGPCCGPNGNDYCCPDDRPMCICGGCWQAGSTQCDTPGHCCAPGLVCCGKDHCCNPTRNGIGEQCLVGCGGIADSATCCLGGQSPRCCPDGRPG
jgi:hypothetical protein